MLCDLIDKKLRDQMTQQILHHRLHLKHQMSSKCLKTNNSPRNSQHHFSKAVDPSVSPTRVFAKQCLFLSGAKLLAGLTAPVHGRCFGFSLTVTWKSHRLQMTMRHGSTPAIARNPEIALTSTLSQKHLQTVVPRPTAHPERNPQV